jgi:hypothetical protein
LQQSPLPISRPALDAEMHQLSNLLFWLSAASFAVMGIGTWNEIVLCSNRTVAQQTPPYFLARVVCPILHHLFDILRHLQAALIGRVLGLVVRFTIRVLRAGTQLDWAVAMVLYFHRFTANTYALAGLAYPLVSGHFAEMFMAHTLPSPATNLQRVVWKSRGRVSTSAYNPICVAQPQRGKFLNLNARE